MMQSHQKHSIHPITIVDQVIDEYKNYLLTEFRARDENLRKALEEALLRPKFLAQEPFFQAYRPFKTEKKWNELGLDAKLADVMQKRSHSMTAYRHQSLAIENLLSNTTQPLVVTTGTGSGKTECFLLPVIQNAIEDARLFKQNGITSIIIYPMNALANDQEARIKDYLNSSGHNYVKVARYDRTTSSTQRADLRKTPPHILLTNYMMLEYLLVRPADRDALFENHRCRYIVLDEVHTYRGSLGSNIALLFRRLKMHLKHATQDYYNEAQPYERRFPNIIPIATSATLKSIDEEKCTPEEIKKLRDQAVQQFMHKITGVEASCFLILGEEIQEIFIPDQVQWSENIQNISPPHPDDPEEIRKTLALLSGLPSETPLEDAISHSALLWKLHELLVKKPRSLSEIVTEIQTTIPQRQKNSTEEIRQEVLTALIAGASLSPEIHGSLKLRVHRFIRGGWEFFRCIDPSCGKLHPLGQEQCECGHMAAPLFLCRSCGADVLGFVGAENPEEAPLEQARTFLEDTVLQWYLYDQNRLNPEENEEETEEAESTVSIPTQKQLKGRSIISGSFDPKTRNFSTNLKHYSQTIILSPTLNKCLVCGAFAGQGKILTSVGLGTSAAIKVLSESLVESLAEQNKGKANHDKKERLLIFSDSRQDAAHQARFINYAVRYDRMRRHVYSILQEQKGPITFENVVQALTIKACENRDNPHLGGYSPSDILPQRTQERVRAWEEVPLLDDIAVSAGFRATLLNLGLVGVHYDTLKENIVNKGNDLCSLLGINTIKLEYLARCILDEMRIRKALSHPHLQYHPLSPSFPEHFNGADWERRFKTPNGYACDEKGEPLLWRESTDIQDGISNNNFWRRPKTGGRAPSIERKYKNLLQAWGGNDSQEGLEKLLHFFAESQLLIAEDLHGYRKSSKLLQVNLDHILLELVSAEERYKCSICNVKNPWSYSNAPCPSCQNGKMKPWPDEEIQKNRYIKRILKTDVLPLNAGEHTAQITGNARIELEENFKAPPEKSPINILACSPTLEMGIDVGGLDAVIMRNIPPRPDNYAQRGGRAGRSSRTGIVLGYTRKVPHDGYFYDKPEEMISGEVPTPDIGLGNKDVIIRHLNSIALGLSQPGLKGKMGEYISIQGEPKREAIEELIFGFEKTFEDATRLALEAWGPEVLNSVELNSRDALINILKQQPEKIRDLFIRTERQIQELRQLIEHWTEVGKEGYRAMNAMDLIRKLLGIPNENKEQNEADDRTSGYPLRRFAEFGLLPGYEFPSFPSTLRLYGDSHQEETLSVERRFGLAQYQPDAPVHARGHRWRVKGIDLSSPWNSKSESPDWCYTVCTSCNLYYGVQENARCPRCRCPQKANGHYPAYEFAGFLAMREDTPVLEDEDRFSMANRVKCHPQHKGRVIQRFSLPTDWNMLIRHEEPIRWVNESSYPTPNEENTLKCLHSQAKGFFLCPTCGRMLTPTESTTEPKKGRKKTRSKKDKDPYGHAIKCSKAGAAIDPIALTTVSKASTLRIEVHLPLKTNEELYKRWGYSLGYALRTGMRQLYMLDGSEIEFELEPFWEETLEQQTWKRGCLTFIDSAVGGSGFLDRAATELHLVAKKALEHLEHNECDSACYRCLKAYQNQRVHSFLSWPHIIPDLELLSSAPPQSIPMGREDIDDPKPWIEAYQAGVGSPLELKFLKLFEQHQIEVEKQVPIAPDEQSNPISTADFVLKGKYVAIYIDGVAFHTGKNLRRDRHIRERLRQGLLQWKVLEFGAKDLKDPNQIITKILSS